MDRSLTRKLWWNTLFIVNVYAIGYVWLQGSAELLRGDTADMLIALGRLAGLFLQYLLLVMLVLASRFRPLEQLYGFDKKIVLHKWLGHFLTGFLLVHPVLLSIGYGLRSERGFVEQFVSFITQWDDVLFATVGTILVLVAGVLSVPYVRKYLTYEVWYFAHLPMYIGVALAFGHQMNSGDVAYGGPLYYWLALNAAVVGMVLAYRFAIPLYRNWKHHFRVVRVVRESKDVTSVYVTGERMDEFHFEAGQWARMIFFQKELWHGHPFSFSAPYDGKELRFSIKALGDWTRRAHELKPGTRVWLEGPLGSFTLAQGATGKHVFIAGGIGITPILAMLRSLPARADAVCFYSVRTRKDLLFENEVAQCSARLVRSLSEEVREGYEHGYVTVDMVRKHCEDFLSRDVYLCGPPHMLAALTSALLAAGLPRGQLHYEKFGF